MTLDQFQQSVSLHAESQTMPALFVGHGSPMNAIEDNEFSRAWAHIGTEIQRPVAILSISAHWCTRGTFVHINEHPEVIYDFYGFPGELYNIAYPVLGSPEFARAVEVSVPQPHIGSDTEWGIDHGTWVVLKHMYPNADIPVFQLSIDIEKPAQFHYDLGKKLRFLRNKGVLIIGSGNIVHNLSRINFSSEAKPFEWARDFDERSAHLMEMGDHDSLIAYEQLGESARLSIPTPDHYFPLLYILGLQDRDDDLSFPVVGLPHGSLSMRSVKLENKIKST